MPTKTPQFDTSMFDLHPVADEKAVVRGEKYRFTVLTSCLIRMEYAEDGVFMDRPTKMVFNRLFPVPAFTVKETEDSLEIETEHLILYYDKKPFSQSLSIAVKGMLMHKCTKWHYGMKEIRMMTLDPNLMGTCETLDMVDGACELEHGLVSRHGFSVFDDTETMAMNKDGWFEPANTEGRKDIYFFGYLMDHTSALKDFQRLSGKTPMIPRYALGNWWSRYYKYTEKTYTDLMNKFAEKKVPLAVSVVDIDWHIMNPPARFGNGWTGFTWNKDFFPNPKRFMKNLHDKNLHITLNIHPGDGIRGFENCYKACAKAMNIDPATEKPVQFDVSNPKFMETWLKHCLRPLEEQGVDFWWIDWQQYDGTEKDGFDPLFMLNHYLYADNCRKGRKGAILSRYAGPGSHRYPIGFSGDTIMSWESLDFQPFFTNAASNIGYGWWSHDIGGHKMGIWSDDMQVRWSQYGVFSPIYRPHSGKDLFFLKEPWNFPGDVETILEDNMRLRHALIPYLYTMAYRNHEEGIPLCMPMYYTYPEMTHNRNFPNQYFFGSELLVFPITSALEPETRTGRVKAWIPGGWWFDFFTGRTYRGDKTMYLHRQLNGIPVLAKAGAIVPMADDGPVNGAPLPKNLKIRAFAGGNGSFSLYEDDDAAMNVKKAFTPFTLKFGKTYVFTKHPAEGEISVIPPVRNYTLEFVGTYDPSKVTVKVAGQTVPSEFTYDEKLHRTTVSVQNVKAEDSMEIRITTDGRLAANAWVKEIEERLPRYQMSNITKAAIVKALNSADSSGAFMAQLPFTTENPYVIGELSEIVCSDK